MGSDTSPSTTRVDNAQDFFKQVPSTGFPATRVQNQPWKKFVPPTESKRPAVQDGKMVVLCSQLHDYGSGALGGY